MRYPKQWYELGNRVYRIWYRFKLTRAEAENMYLRGVRVAVSGRVYFVKPGDWRSQFPGGNKPERWNLEKAAKHEVFSYGTSYGTGTFTTGD